MGHSYLEVHKQSRRDTFNPIVKFVNDVTGT